jgi:sugar phosphate isomerase/epimerase
MTRAISLAALTVLELNPPDMISCAAEAGYSHVGIRILPATPEEVSYDIIGDTPMTREMSARLAATGVKVLDIEIFRLKPDTRVADYRAALETGARLGAKHMLVAGNDPDPTRLTDRFAELCDLAQPLGLTADLEPMPWTDLKNVKQASRLLAEANRPNGGLLVDPLHFDRSGSTIADLCAVPHSRFHYMQLCDAPAERPRDVAGLLHHARAERLFPGEGGLDLRGLLLAIPRNIPIGVEVPTLDLARSVPAVERARRILAATKALLASLDETPGI